MATIHDFLGSVAARLAGRQKTRLQNYQELVIALDAGKKMPDPDKVADLLEAANKTLDDLQADVKLLADRKSWKALTDSLPRIQKRMAEIDVLFQEQKKRYNQQLRDANRENDEAVSRLKTEYMQLMGEQFHANNAAVKLADSNGRRKEMNDLIKQATTFDIRNLRVELESKVSHWSATIAALKPPLDRETQQMQKNGDKSEGPVAKEVRMAKLALARWQAELDALNQQTEELTQKASAIYAEDLQEALPCMTN